MATACYVPRYVRASFKGVPFEALEATSEHGRRGAEGEFPFGEITGYADLGRAIRRYTISGRIATNDHVARAAAVIAAVETPGPGVLMHPTRGAVVVACPRLTVRDGVDQEQGVTFLEFDFVEGNDWASGFNFGALLGGISLAAIIAATSEHLSDNYNPDIIRWYQLNPVLDTARDSIQVVSTQYQKAVALSSSQKEWRILADFASITNDPHVLRSAKSYATALSNGLGILDSTMAGTSKVAAFRSIANWGAKVSALTDEAAIAQNSIYTSVRVLGAAFMVRGLLETTTTTLDAALADYDTVMRILSEEAAVANSGCYDPKYYLSLRDFIVQVQALLLDRAYNLPALVTFKFSGGVHALVAAYEIFDDAKRVRDIESRNPQYLPWAMGPEIIASRLT